MIRKALNEICHISADADINAKNYIYALDYIDNLFHITSVLKKHLKVQDITFLPSFKSQSICEQYQIPYTLDETRFTLIKFKSDLFLVNRELADNICKDLLESGYCSSTEIDSDTGVICTLLK